MKSLFASKTFWVNALTAVVGVVGYIAGSDLIAQYPDVAAILATVVGGLNVVLRLITDKAVSLTGK